MFVIRGLRGRTLRPQCECGLGQEPRFRFMPQNSNQLANRGEIAEFELRLETTSWKVQERFILGFLISIHITETCPSHSETYVLSVSCIARTSQSGATPITALDVLFFASP